MTKRSLRENIPDISELLYAVGDLSIVLSRVQKQGLPLIGRVLPDIVDNIPLRTIPSKIVTYDRSSAEHLLRQFVPKPVQRSLEQIATGLESNSTQAVSVRIGTREQGNNHCHKYVITRSGENTLFYLVDQEQDIGTFKSGTPRIRNLLRPHVVNLFAVELIAGRLAQFAQLRYRTSGLPIELQKGQKKLEECAVRLIGSDTPDFLKGREENIIYFFSLNQDRVVLQARYVSSEQLALYAKNGRNIPRIIKNQIDGLMALYDQGIAAHSTYQKS